MESHTSILLSTGERAGLYVGRTDGQALMRMTGGFRMRARSLAPEPGLLEGSRYRGKRPRAVV